MRGKREEQHREMDSTCKLQDGFQPQSMMLNRKKLAFSCRNCDHRKQAQCPRNKSTRGDLPRSTGKLAECVSGNLKNDVICKKELAEDQK